MNLRQPIRYFFSVLFAAILASCATQSEDKNKNSEEFDEANESLKEQVELLLNNMPSPTEIPYLLQATGAEFNQSLLNPRGNVDQYTTRSDKSALNLGPRARSAAGVTIGPAEIDWSVGDVLLLAACAVLGGWGGQKVGLPAAINVPNCVTSEMRICSGFERCVRLTLATAPASDVPST